MDLTDTLSDLPDSGEDPPDFEAWESPGGLLKGGPIRERMRDVLVQLRELTKVSAIATRADCDSGSAVRVRRTDSVVLELITVPPSSLCPSNYNLILHIEWR